MKATDTQLLDLMEEHCIQLTKGGYRWRDSWEARVPDPGGHYREENERTVAYGTTPREALQEAFEHFSSRSTGRKDNTL